MNNYEFKLFIRTFIISKKTNKIKTSISLLIDNDNINIPEVNAKLFKHHNYIKKYYNNSYIFKTVLWITYLNKSQLYKDVKHVKIHEYLGHEYQHETISILYKRYKEQFLRELESNNSNIINIYV
jgi:hypothetical protein